MVSISENLNVHQVDEFQLDNIKLKTHLMIIARS